MWAAALNKGGVSHFYQRIFFVLFSLESVVGLLYVGAAAATCKSQ